MVDFWIDRQDWVALFSRLILALFVGALIGLDRQRRHKAAGLRTHMLVSLGAAIFILIPLQGGASNDSISRTIQGIAAGIGFLGAGEILHQSRPNGQPTQVKGLTSAASIWVTAALGIGAGCGLWQLAIVGSALTLITLELIKYLERTLLIRERDESED